MENNQNMIAAINCQRPIWIKFHDHSGLFHQSQKKMAIVERLSWPLETRSSGRWRCREVAVVESFKQESMYRLSL